jgi:DNA-binding NarL/FixJ family response regulator
MTDVARSVAQPPRAITVVVAHRRDADRDSLVRWLTADGRFEVVAQAADTDAAAAAIDATLPQVALVDIDLPGDTDGLALLAGLRETRPAVRTIAVSDEDDDRAYSAVRAGAGGVYLWSDPLSPLTAVVAGAARGEGALSAGWAGRLIDEVGWLSREPGPVPAPELSPTELEVIRRVASGATPAAIAALHGVTEHVVNLNAAGAVTKVFRHHDDTRRLGLAG